MLLLLESNVTTLSLSLSCFSLVGNAASKYHLKVKESMKPNEN